MTIEAECFLSTVDTRGYENVRKCPLFSWSDVTFVRILLSIGGEASTMGCGLKLGGADRCKGTLARARFLGVRLRRVRAGIIAGAENAAHAGGCI